ncbi:MAG: tetratricopeptide repeat protein [Bacteroidetes bacterium]|nr:tetratricopeptide repeat protein [Bacteroidota bacterium]
MVKETKVFENAEPVDAWDKNMQTLVQELLNSDQVDSSVKAIHQQMADSGETKSLLLAAANAWKLAGYGIFSGYFHEKLGLVYNQPENWFKAGKNFYEILYAINDSSIKYSMLTHAISAFEKAIMLDSSNLDAKAYKADLLLSYQMGPPMNSVLELKKILANNPNHENSLLIYAQALITIGSTDKAEQTLKHLTSVSRKPYYWQFLAEEIYVAQKRYTEALAAYQQHVSLLKDSISVKSANARIKQIEQEL